MEKGWWSTPEIEGLGSAIEIYVVSADAVGVRFRRMYGTLDTHLLLQDAASTLFTLWVKDFAF